LGLASGYLWNIVVGGPLGIRDWCVALIVMLTSWPAWAGSETDLLSDAPRFQKSVLGEYQFVIMLNDRAAIGTFNQTVTRTPKKEQGTYLVESQMEMLVGPARFGMEERAWLDRYGAAVKVRQVETEGNAQEGSTRITENAKTRTDLGWVFNKLKSSGDSWEAKLEEDRAHWGEVSSLLVLLRVANLEHSGTWTFEEVVWTPGGKGIEVVEFSLSVGEVGSYTHHGRELKAVEIQVDKPAERSSIFVDLEGKILEISPNRGQPIKLVACEGEECARLQEPPPLEGPAAAVMTLFKVTAGALDVDALDRVMDWESIAAHARSSGAEMSAEDAKREFKESLSKKPAMGLELLEVLPAMLEVRIDDERATVSLAEGQGMALKLGLVDGEWKVVEAPR